MLAYRERVERAALENTVRARPAGRWWRLGAPFALASISLAACGACGGAPRTPVASASSTPEPQLDGAGRRDPTRSPLGTNLDALRDWSTELVFIDQFRTSRPWTSAAAMGEPDDEQPIDVDAHGWVRSLRPNQIVRTGLLWDNEHAPAGRYVVLFDGEGDLEYFGGAAGHVVESRPGRQVLEWDARAHGAGLGMAITRTDPDNPIRNVRVLLPGGVCEGNPMQSCDEQRACAADARCLPFEETLEQGRFNPDFLAELDLYRVVRFMNWQDVNDSPLRTWAQRPRLDDARWSDGRGAPLEVILELANLLRVDPWLHLPHQVDDEYAEQMGHLVQEHLAPERRVWLEYSNEIWNDIFSQHEYSIQQGFALGLVERGGDPTFAQIRFQAARSVQLFRAFSRGFADRERVTRVLAGHSVNAWLTNELLSYEGTAREVDAFAVAPYFGRLIAPGERDSFLSRELDDVLDEAERELIPAELAHVREQREVTARWGVSLVAYEAGQHYVGVQGLEHDAELNARLDALDSHPRFESLYTQYLEGWTASGGDLLVHFVHCAGPSGYGRFGASYWLGQPRSQTPKLRAIVRFVDQHPLR